MTWFLTCKFPVLTCDMMSDFLLLALVLKVLSWNFQLFCLHLGLDMGLSWLAVGLSDPHFGWDSCWPGLDLELNLGLAGLDWRLESKTRDLLADFVVPLFLHWITYIQYLYVSALMLFQMNYSWDSASGFERRLLLLLLAMLGCIHVCNFLVQGFLLELYRRKQWCLRATSGNTLLIIGLNVFLAPSPQFSESCRSTVWPWSLRCFMDRQSKEAEWWSPGACELLSRLKCVFITP